MDRSWVIAIFRSSTASVTKRLSRAAASWRLFSGAKWGIPLANQQKSRCTSLGIWMLENSQLPGRSESHTQRRQRLRLYAQLLAHSPLASLAIKVSVWKVEWKHDTWLLISSLQIKEACNSPIQSSRASCCVANPSRNGIQWNQWIQCQIFSSSPGSQMWNRVLLLHWAATDNFNWCH